MNSPMNENDLKRVLANFRAEVNQKDSALSGHTDRYILLALLQAIRTVLVNQPNNMGRGIEAQIYEETEQYLQNLLAIPGAIQKAVGSFDELS